MSKVLIAIDMQRDFIDGALGSEAARAIVKPVANYIKQCKENDFIIITTRDCHDTDFIETKEGKFFPKHCLNGEDGFMVASEINEVLDSDNDYCICKPTFGSFDLVNLLFTLDEEEGIDEIQICGLVTDICVLANTTLIASAFPNTKITVLSNLCAGTSVENHQMALKMMEGMLVDVTKADIKNHDDECHCGDCGHCPPKD